jgi:hypothetical protein
VLVLASATACAAFEGNDAWLVLKLAVQRPSVTLLFPQSGFPGECT